MKSDKLHIKVSKEDILKANKKASREIELENSNGWTCTHKVHKTLKRYTRKPKHQKLSCNE